MIEQGSGQDFAPVLVEVFLECRDEVTEIYNKFRTDIPAGEIVAENQTK